MLPNVLQRSASDHVPVLAEEVRELLAVQPGETVVDATFGAGGHSRLLAADLQGEGKLIAIDRDPSARTYFDRFKARSGGVQARFLRGEFSLVLNQLAANDVQADAILLDLGVSSMQLDRPERGFSYAADAPLDMRMDTAAELSARELVNEADERELALIFKRFGEERYARQIARAIVRRRDERPFERTTDLADTIKQAIPTPARFGDGHPAKRVFQALRIAVNDELGALEAALPAAMRMLRPGGRIAVISFHSLEDRIVKQFIREQARGCTCPPEFPICVCGNEPLLRDLTRKPLRPGARELEANPRAASAKLRAAAKVDVLMASWAGTARVDSPPVPQPRRRPRPRTAPKRRARTRPFGGVVWIVVLAVLLAGVVAVNVAVLQLNVRLDELGRERIELQGETKRLSSQLSSASANARIESQARTKLGLVRADPELTFHVQLAPPTK